MPKDAPPNGGAALDETPKGPRRRVSEMQTKLHRWAAADPGRRFDDLFNFVHDPATLIVVFDRVAGNRGARCRDRRHHGRRRRATCWRSRVSGRPVCPVQGGHVPAVAGEGTEDPQAGRVGKGQKPRYSYRGRPGRAGRVEAGAGTDLRSRLRAGLLCVPATTACPVGCQNSALAR